MDRKTGTISGRHYTRQECEAQGINEEIWDGKTSEQSLDMRCNEDRDRGKREMGNSKNEPSHKEAERYGRGLLFTRYSATSASSRQATSCIVALQWGTSALQPLRQVVRWRARQ